MNFDFLKNSRELGYVYENCSNAEKLALTMPVQSIFTSRKSAELLAKLIYMAAHNRKMEELTFADILSDKTVRDFVRSRDIMDAFHFIRKIGNRAVHGYPLVGGEREEALQSHASILHCRHADDHHRGHRGEARPGLVCEEAGEATQEQRFGGQRRRRHLRCCGDALYACLRRYHAPHGTQP